MTLPLGDEFFIKKTFALAKKGAGFTSPNPMVGAVIVKGGRVVGQGYHRKAGLPHAEIEAIKSAREDLKGSTLYVNLEPCSHFGKTPPCTEAIIKSGIKKVVCAALDPNPKVSGQGIKKLREAGIEVSAGVLEKEAKELNEAFLVFHKKNRPYVALKFASSLDGKIATKSFDSRGITGREALDYSYKLRGNFQAILVGINTVLKDNPNLGTHSKRPDPLRIVLDSKLKIPLNSQVLRDKNTLIVTTKLADKVKRENLEERGIEVLVFKGERIGILEVLQALRKKGIISVLVEGGGEVLASFFEENLFDKVYTFIAPKIIGGQEGISAVGGKGVDLISKAIKLRILENKKLGEDLLIISKPI